MTPREVAEHIARLGGSTVRRAGRGSYRVPCPAHADREPSLHISSGAESRVLIRCFAGCATADVLRAADLSYRDLCGQAPSTTAQPCEEYHYEDEAGRRLYTVTRRGHGPGKRFGTHYVDGSGTVVTNARGLRRVLYHLPEVAAAVRAGEEVYLCEGEKDADAVRRAYRVTATTNAFGATAWAGDCQKHGYDRCLKGAVIVIVEHRDRAGRERTQQLLTSLSDVAAALRVVQAARGNDAHDHVAAGLPLAAFVPIDLTQLALVDDGRYAGLPYAFFRAAGACNLSHLEFRVLIEVARNSVRREDRRTVWQSQPCPSSWLARRCGNASPSAVRAAVSRLRAAGILEAAAAGSECRPGLAPELRVCERYGEWRPLRKAQAGGLRSQPACRGAAPASCKGTNTREDEIYAREGVPDWLAAEAAAGPRLRW